MNAVVQLMVVGTGTVAAQYCTYGTWVLSGVRRKFLVDVPNRKCYIFVPCDRRAHRSINSHVV